MKNNRMLKHFKARHQAVLGITIKSSETKGNPFRALKQVMLDNSLYEHSAQ